MFMSNINNELNPDIVLMLPYHLTNKVSKLVLVKVELHNGTSYQGWAEANKFYEVLNSGIIELMSEEFGVLRFTRSELNSYSATLIMKRFIH